MTNLNEILFFTTVARQGSFSGAARLLNVPVSMVSRKISDLEKRLGLILIRRTTRQLKLTAEGSLLFERCSMQVQDIQEAEANLHDSQGVLQGGLSVTAPVALGRGEFIEFIAGFMNKYPRIVIDLQITNEFVDLVTGNVDVAIRFGELKDSSAIARKLGISRRILAASPHYLKGKKQLRHPDDLKEHDCIIFSSKVFDDGWELTKDRQKTRIQVKGKIKANNFETISELADQGLGIAFLPEGYVSAQKSSNLKQILPQWTSPTIPVHAIYLNRKHIPSKLQTFLSELAQLKTSFWKS